MKHQDRPIGVDADAAVELGVEVQLNHPVYQSSMTLVPVGGERGSPASNQCFWENGGSGGGGLASVLTSGALAISAVDRWNPLLHHPAGGCLLRLPCLHELSGQLTQLFRVGCRFQGAIELFDLKALLDGELNAAVHVDLHEGVIARYRQKTNNLLQIARISRFFRNLSLNRCSWDCVCRWCGSFS